MIKRGQLRYRLIHHKFPSRLYALQDNSELEDTDCLLGQSGHAHSEASFSTRFASLPLSAVR